MLRSHIMWDLEHSTSRHAREIAQLRNQLGRCTMIYTRKCLKKERPCPAPVPSPCRWPVPSEDSIRAGVATAAVVIAAYVIVSEGSRIVCPVRNLVPVP